MKYTQCVSMYIKTICPVCGEPVCHDLLIREKVKLSKVPETEIIDVQVLDSCTVDELSHEVLMSLSRYVYNGISTNELCRILKDKFRILERYCCDIVQRLKIELDMYCPDRQHLYFVAP